MSCQFAEDPTIKPYNPQLPMDYLSLKDITASHAEEIHAAIRRVTDSGWYLQGKENERFENDYAEYIGTRFCGLRKRSGCSHTYPSGIHGTRHNGSGR